MVNIDEERKQKHNTLKPSSQILKANMSAKLKKVKLASERAPKICNKKLSDFQVKIYPSSCDIHKRRLSMSRDVAVIFINHLIKTTPWYGDTTSAGTSGGGSSSGGGHVIHPSRTSLVRFLRTHRRGTLVSLTHPHGQCKYATWARRVRTVRLSTQESWVR